MGSPQAVVAQRPEGRALRRARTGRADDGFQRHLRPLGLGRRSDLIGVCLPESFQFRTQRKQQSSFTSSHIIGDPHSKSQQYITRVSIQHGRCTVPLRGELYTSAMLSGPEVSVKMPVNCSRCKIRSCSSQLARHRTIVTILLMT